MRILPLSYKNQQRLTFSPWRTFPVFVAILAILFASSANAQSDWRKEVGVFRIGLVVGDDIAGAVARVEPFRLAVAEALNLNVEIFAAQSYADLISALVATRIEHAIISASAYSTTWLLCECVEPLVIPKSSDGQGHYKSVLIAGKNDPVTLANLAASRLAGLTKNSFAGHKFAAFELKQQGIVPPTKIEFSQLGENTIQRFVAGEYDALIGWSSLIGDPTVGYSRGTLKLIAEQNGGKTLPFRVLWESSLIPHHPHVIKKSLAAEAKTLLRAVLTNMYNSDPVAYDSIEPNFGGGFIAARHGQFTPIIEYVKSLSPVARKSEEKNANENQKVGANPSAEPTPVEN